MAEHPRDIITQAIHDSRWLKSPDGQQTGFGAPAAAIGDAVLDALVGAGLVLIDPTNPQVRTACVEAASDAWEPSEAILNTSEIVDAVLRAAGEAGESKRTAENLDSPTGIKGNLDGRAAGEASNGVVDDPHCDYCGTLIWTVTKYGRVTHKESCPHRSDPWSQTYPTRGVVDEPEEAR